MRTEPRPSTPAQQFVNERLTAMMPPDGQYRCGALLLSYPASNPGDNSRIAFGFALREVSEECARDMVDMVKTLRVVADQIESLYQKKQGEGSTDG